MKRISLILFMFFSSFSTATDAYFAQASAGGNTGANCANARAISSIVSGDWGSDNNVHLCGTITSAITVGASGTSGHPTKLIFETGAIMSGTWNPAITANKNWVVIDGGIPNGTIQGTASGNTPFSLSSISCNGTTCTATCTSTSPDCGFFTTSDGVPAAYSTVSITGTTQATLNTSISVLTFTGCTVPCSGVFTFAAPGGFNGSATGGQAGVLCPNGSYCTAAGNVVGISASSGCNNCEFKNLTFSNLFWEWSPTVAAQVNFGVTGAIFAGSNTSGSFLSIHDNTCHDVRACVSYTPTVASDNALSCGTSTSPASGVWNNNFYNADGMNFENNGVASSGVCFHDNHVHDPINWDSAATWGTNPSTYSCDYHHDGIHFWGLTSGVNTGHSIYNNLFDGAWGVCPTGSVFLEGANPGYQLFNNVFAPSYKQEQNGIVNVNGSGNNLIANNTIIGFNSASFAGLSDLCLNFGAPSGTPSMTVRNNIVIRCNTILETQNSPTYAAVDNNTWGECAGSSGNCNGSTPFVVNGSGFDTFAAWKTACSCDASAQYNSVVGHWNLNYTTGVPAVGSGVIGFGANLTGLGITALNSDTSAGNTRVPLARPSSGAWDGGAFQFVTPTGVPAVWFMASK